AIACFNNSQRRAVRSPQTRQVIAEQTETPDVPVLLGKWDRRLEKNLDRRSHVSLPYGTDQGCQLVDGAHYVVQVSSRDCFAHEFSRRRQPVIPESGKIRVEIPQ